MSAEANRRPHHECEDRMAIERDAAHQHAISDPALFDGTAAPVGAIMLDAKVVPWRIAPEHNAPQRRHAAGAAVRREGVVHGGYASFVDTCPSARTSGSAVMPTASGSETPFGHQK